MRSFNLQQFSTCGNSLSARDRPVTQEHQSKRNSIKRKNWICVKQILWYTSVAAASWSHAREIKLKNLILLLLIAPGLLAQERKVDPTWLHRFISMGSESGGNASAGSCHFKPMFGEGDADGRVMRTVARFGELAVGPKGECPVETEQRQEGIYFVLSGNAVLHYGEQTFSMRARDFTYVPPGVKHSIGNGAQQELRVLWMDFKIPQRMPLGTEEPRPKIVNLNDVKEETVQGHPSSVLYKLMAGPRTGKRDAIDQAYVVTSLFWMDFAPGGTNFPHHHEAAEEIYVVMDGEGEIVAGSGTDGIEGRYPAKAGDAYYFRPNCTVGFYNEDKPNAKAHILAVRARIPPPDEDD
jgi:mannose-6-phosphate isomerase-like protein (cupin superfamily)